VNLLSFALALGAVVFPLAWIGAAVSLVLAPLVRRLSPVGRAELAAWLAVAPALAAVAVGLAVAAPSLLAGLGLAADHCDGHGHHPHLCAVHGAALPAWLAVVGAAGWAVFGLRASAVLSRLVAAERLGAALAKLGRGQEGFVLVPATVPVCHAVGLVEPRVLVSEAVVARLDSDALRAVLAHEHAHLRRSDPRWSALLSLAACVAPPALVWVGEWRDAAEEAADDLAALETDGATVARALVTVARMNLGPAHGLAFGATRLERRVVRLLAGAAAPRPSRALLGALWMTLAAGGLVIGAHDRLHHAAEEGWERLVGVGAVVSSYYSR
jgi:Zn-dependent protease with chaperone function